jgi:opacity protein-like surface antigen
MRNKILMALLMSAAIAAPASAGVYGSLRVGAQTLNDVKSTAYLPDSSSVSGVTAAASGSIPANSDRIGFSIDTKAGVAFAGEVGYDFGLVRAGVELSYASNKVKGFKPTSLNGVAVSSTTAAAGSTAINSVLGDDNYKVQQFAALANAWIDIPVGEFPVKPYVGGGIGISSYRLKSDEGSNKKDRFAWQLGAGVAIPVSGKISINADYRYRQVNGWTLQDDATSGIVAGRLKSSQFTLGVGYGF